MPVATTSLVFLEAVIEGCDPRLISQHYCESHPLQFYVKPNIGIRNTRALHCVLDTFSAYKEPQKESCQVWSKYVGHRTAFTSEHGVQMARLCLRFHPALVLIISPCLCLEILLLQCFLSCNHFLKVATVFWDWGKIRRRRTGSWLSATVV